MNTIYLATGDNERYMQALQATGLTPVSIPPHSEMLPAPMDAVTAGESLLVIELTPCRFPLLKLRAASGTLPYGKTICLADAPDESVRRDLLELGISDLLPDRDPDLLTRYVDAISGCRNIPGRGRVLAREDDGPFARILGNIAERYGYALELAGSIDALLSRLEDGPAELILVNIGTPGFDMAEFVKKSYASAGIKKYPLAAYKDMKDGLYVHEITTGLNRLTRTILSRDELLNLLITLFYKNETGPLAGMARSLLDAGDDAGTDTRTLRRIFYDSGPELCTMTSLFDKARFSRAMETGAALHRAILKTAGFRWLITPPRECATCGGGA